MPIDLCFPLSASIHDTGDPFGVRCFFETMSSGSSISQSKANYPTAALAGYCGYCWGAMEDFCWGIISISGFIEAPLITGTFGCVSNRAGPSLTLSFHSSYNIGAIFFKAWVAARIFPAFLFYAIPFPISLEFMVTVQRNLKHGSTPVVWSLNKPLSQEKLTLRCT